MYKKKIALSIALASSLLLSSPTTLAHGGSAEYLPITEALNSSGASYELRDRKSVV